MTMPTSVATPPTITYPNDAVALKAVPFKFIDATDLKVTALDILGAETLLELNVGYSVAGGKFDIGSITVLAVPAGTTEIRIDRVTKDSQELDYRQGDGFDAESHEQGLDRLTMLVQDVERDALQAGAKLASALEKVLVGGVGIEIIRIGDKITIACTLESVGGLADMLMLSGDQQAGGSSGTGDGTLAENVRDIMAAALQAGAGVVITPDDVGNKIVIELAAGVGGDNLTAAGVIGIIGGALEAGTNISIVANGTGDGYIISATGLDATFRGLVPSDVGGDFTFTDARGGRAINWTGGGTQAVLDPESLTALSDGWACVVRNDSAVPLTIARGAGVALYKNGSQVSANATIAAGGLAQIQRWAADEFTITGAKVS